jgi:hypothetical protein
MDEWLTQARDALAAVTGAELSELDLSDADADTLLDLARIAAHTSGARTNAPLLCYLVGRAQGARGVDELAEVIRRSTS